MSSCSVRRNICTKVAKWYGQFLWKGTVEVPKEEIVDVADELGKMIGVLKHKEPLQDVIESLKRLKEMKASQSFDSVQESMKQEERESENVPEITLSNTAETNDEDMRWIPEKFRPGKEPVNEYFAHYFEPSEIKYKGGHVDFVTFMLDFQRSIGRYDYPDEHKLALLIQAMPEEYTLSEYKTYTAALNELCRVELEPLPLCNEIEDIISELKMPESTSDYNALQRILQKARMIHRILSLTMGPTDSFLAKVEAMFNVLLPQTTRSHYLMKYVSMHERGPTFQDFIEYVREHAIPAYCSMCYSNTLLSTTPTRPYQPYATSQRKRVYKNFRRKNTPYNRSYGP